MKTLQVNLTLKDHKSTGSVSFTHDETYLAVSAWAVIDSTPQPLYNTVRYNTVLDITRISVGPKISI